MPIRRSAWANIFITAERPFWKEDGFSPGMWTNSGAGTVYPQYFGAADDEVTGFTVQGRGELALAWDRMGRERAMASAVETLGQLRPATRGAVKALHYHSRGAEEFSTAAWAYFMPGQIRELQAAIATPAGRIHFCGEHTATAARGIEVALESFERVALAVLFCLGGAGKFAALPPPKRAGPRGLRVLWRAGSLLAKAR